MKTLILFSTISLLSSLGFAQSNNCGQTSPRLCVGDIVWTQEGVDGWNGTYEAKVTGVSSDFKSYSVKLTQYNDSASNKTIDGLGVTTGRKCSNTNPRICVGDLVYTNSGVAGWNGTYRAKVLALSANYTKVSVALLDYSDKASNKPVSAFAVTNRCGTSKPKLCVGDQVTTKSGYAGWNGNYHATVIAVSTNLTDYSVKLRDYSDIASNKPVGSFNIVSRANSTGLDSMSVYMSTDTQDIVSSFSSLASVTTKERADFLNSSSAYITQLNSEDVNIFSGMVLAKIIRLSTSQVVKDNFETPAINFTTELEKNNWKSIDQIEANLRTLDFATRVIYAAVKLKLTMAQVDPKDNQDLLQLGQIAAMTQLSRKIAALQQFCESKRHIVEELIQDPRHGVLGMVTADVMGWVLSK